MRYIAEWTAEGTTQKSRPFEDREDARTRVNSLQAAGVKDAFVREVPGGLSDTELQTAVVKFMFCDAMQNTEDWESYRGDMLEVESEIAAELGSAWSEHTADWCVGTKMSTMEVVLWPVENWEGFKAIARGESPR